MIAPRTDVSSAFATCAPAMRQSPVPTVKHCGEGAAASSTTAGGGGTAFLCRATCFTRSGDAFVVCRGEAGGDGGVTFGAGSSDGDDEGSDGDEAGGDDGDADEHDNSGDDDGGIGDDDGDMPRPH